MGRRPEAAADRGSRRPAALTAGDDGARRAGATAARAVEALNSDRAGCTGRRAGTLDEAHRRDAGASTGAYSAECSRPDGPPPRAAASRGRPMPADVDVLTRALDDE